MERGIGASKSLDGQSGCVPIKRGGGIGTLGKNSSSRHPGLMPQVWGALLWLGVGLDNLTERNSIEKSETAEKEEGVEKTSSIGKKRHRLISQKSRLSSIESRRLSSSMSGEKTALVAWKE